MSYRLAKGAVRHGRRTLLEDIGPFIFQEKAPSAARLTGTFLTVAGAPASCILRLALGTISNLKRLSFVYRDEPFWMNPATGRNERAVCPETQFVLAERRDGTFLILVPVFGKTFRFSLSNRDGGLLLVGETGDPATIGTGDLALYVAHGDDPYALIAAGAKEVAARLGAKLRSEKPLPDFADEFGWCTWDAFYQEVSEAGVRAGLEGFRAGGLMPRFMILDDGWQYTHATKTGERRLLGFGADPKKFPHGLASLVKMAKGEFGLPHFLVWHAFVGYWSGVDTTAFADYGARDALRNYGPGILAHMPSHNLDWWGQFSGLIPPDQIARFYADYHASLKAAGVDGVKVDNQGVLESLAFNTGGRVALTRAYREGLESSVRQHFVGRLINCMSNANETHLMARDSTLLRTSIDFWPLKPETHGRHLYTNALVSLWFGEFIHADWDMFHSKHEWGAYHAAGRAVSGSPIYVSDKPAQHDFALLRRLVLPDGTVARCDGQGRPSPECLFTDVTREDKPLKIFNRNGPAAVVGVFHCRYQPGRPTPAQTTRVSPADVPGLPRGRYALHVHTTGRLVAPAARPSARITLAQAGWEIVTLAPEDRGVAIIGLSNLLNSAGAVTTRGWKDRATYAVTLKAGGRLLAWTKRRPTAVRAGGAAVSATWQRGRLEVALPEVAGPLEVELVFDTRRPVKR